MIKANAEAMIEEHDLLVWVSDAEKVPALNIAGDSDYDGSLAVELYVRRGEVIGVNVTDTTGVVASHGLVPAETVGR